ncbi:hypothetical protein ACHAWO_012197 [Cyclotella atomus]|jgi:hypothetical protein|uniref:Uncharacterized protein n=1 Tax=Cyclotella atomus TaxID=382360 RepID=A0ABD3PE84_9STRA
MANALYAADKSDDDFHRGIAGIELAMSLIVGGKPLVSSKMPSGHVQMLRDFFDEDSGKVHMSVPNSAAAEEATKYIER